MIMLTEKQLEQLPQRIIERINKVNTIFLQVAGKRIRDIGTISNTDAYRIKMQLDIAADINEIELALAAVGRKNIADIEDMFDIIAADNNAFAESMAKATGTTATATSTASLAAYVEALKQQAVEEYGNFSNNTAFMVYRNGQKVSTSLHQFYSETIDNAIIAVTSGQSDYYSRMRHILRLMADTGIRTKYKPLKGAAGATADYATKYSRRLDTAVRQNLLWGIKQCNATMMEKIGEEFGANGYEIDYHSNPRPSHAEMGGRQYIIAEKGKRINGVYYPPFSEVSDLLEDYNCLHRKKPIICGVSVPNHTPEELAKLKAQDKKKIEFEGEEYTGYELTQLQRKTETAIRHAKDRQIIAAAAGDDELRRTEQEKINILTRKYAKLCDVSGLPSKKERMSVAGYHRVKTLEEIDPNLTFIRDQVKIKRNSNLPKKIDLPNELTKVTSNVDLPNLQGIVPKGANATKVYVMAGKGTSSPINDIKRLYSTYPKAGKAEDWQKKSADVYADNYKYVIHWYENNGTVPPEEMKTKGVKKL